MQELPEVLRLHIGGKEVKPGWKIFNIRPGEGVDFVGNIGDLSRFEADCCDEIYASHVLEHVAVAQLLPTLKGFHRILKPGGCAMISVPDLEVLCKLFLSPDLDLHQRFHVMIMMFGGQTDEHDFHFVGLSFEFLADFLEAAGFSRIQPVESFGLFNDASDLAPYGAPISLNVAAYK